MVKKNTTKKAGAIGAFPTNATVDTAARREDAPSQEILTLAVAESFISGKETDLSEFSAIEDSAANLLAATRPAERFLAAQNRAQRIRPPRRTSNLPPARRKTPIQRPKNRDL